MSRVISTIEKRVGESFGLEKYILPFNSTKYNTKQTFHQPSGHQKCFFVAVKYFISVCNQKRKECSVKVSKSIHQMLDIIDRRVKVDIFICIFWRIRCDLWRYITHPIGSFKTILIEIIGISTLKISCYDQWFSTLILRRGLWRVVLSWNPFNSMVIGHWSLLMYLQFSHNPLCEFVDCVWYPPVLTCFLL